MSRSQFVIVATSYYLYLYEVSGSKVSRLQCSLADSDGFEEFKQGMEKYRKKPIRILANLYDEEFKFISTPHTNVIERNKLMQRKLQQHFRKHEYKRAYYQGRKTTGRKDDAILLSSLGSCEILGQLIDILCELSVPISGIYSVQSMYKTYLQPLMEGRDALFMTEIENGNPSRVAVRQSFYKDGKLKLSRVANIYVSNTDAYKEDVIEELETSRQYLVREHYIEDANTLPVVFVHSTSYLENLSTDDHPMGHHFSLEHISSRELASLLGIECDSECIQFEDISAIGSLSAGKQLQYQSPKAAYYYRHHILGRILNWSAAASFFAMTLLSGYMFFKGNEYRGDIAVKRSSIELAERLVEQRQQKIERFNENIRSVQLAVDFVNERRSGDLSTHELVDQIGRVLANYPDIGLTRIKWEEHFEEEGDTDQSADDFEDWIEDDEFLVDEGNDAEQGSGALTRVEIFAHPLNVGTNIRKAMEDVDGFLSELAAAESIDTASVVEYPFNLESNSELKGKVANSEYVSLSDNTDFRIEVLYRNESR